MRRNTHKPAPDGGGEVFDTSIEVPVTIRDPNKPIGTMCSRRWRASGGPALDRGHDRQGDDAKAALDRITIPQDVLDRIAPTALPRSSIIISDEPPTRETNYRTEFVTALNDQPQGGIITRARSLDIRVGFSDGWGFDNTPGRGRQYYDPRQDNRNYYQRPQRWW